MQKSKAKEIRERWRQTVASVLGAARRKVGLTQEELAKRVGWSRDKLAKIETGERKVEFGEVVMLADAIGQRDLIILQILTWRL